MKLGVYTKNLRAISEAARAMRHIRAGVDAEIVVTSHGRVGVITDERMCGKAPGGMTKCYEIQWHDDSLSE